MRMRMVAIVAAVLALVAPASVAHADPVNPIEDVDITSSSTSFYPAVDGYQDTLDLNARVFVAGADRRVRASMMVTLGSRIAKTWLITRSGETSVVWDGLLGGKIVPGTYTVTLRAVDDDGTVYTTSRPATVSAKKITKITRVTKQPAWLTGFCRDNKVVIDSQKWFVYQDKICPVTRTATGAITKKTMRGRVSSGPIMLESHIDKTGPPMSTTWGPILVSVTAKFTQSGSGLNQFYLCETGSCDLPTRPGTLQTFGRSGTYTTTGVSDYPRWPDWRIVVQPGHDLSMTSFTIKVTYYEFR